MSSTVLAVIPARGGSRGVPRKNLAEVGGTPLVGRAVRACLAARLVTDVTVSTDDPEIAAAARAAGAAVTDRPAALASDHAGSEGVLLHALDAHPTGQGGAVEIVLLVQCTSPFVTGEDLDRAVAAVRAGADSALTAAPFHGFLWRPDGPATAGTAQPDPTGGATAPAGATALPDGTPPTGHGVNHDPAHRPRRQDRPAELLETGAVYAMRADGFRAARHRFFGRTTLVPTDPARVLEIDDPHDLARARALAPLLDGAAGWTPAGARTTPPTATGAVPAPRPGCDDVDAVVLDFDGTQTDDRVLVDAEGRETVAVHRGDGLGVAALRRAGLPLLILSTEENPVVAARARKLRVPVLHGVAHKDTALKQWCDQEGVDPERVLYAGNDVNDLPCFQLVGWPVAVAGAHDAVRAAARAVTTAPGGGGAVREIATWLLGKELNQP